MSGLSHPTPWTVLVKEGERGHRSVYLQDARGDIICQMMTKRRYEAARLIVDLINGEV